MAAAAGVVLAGGRSSRMGSAKAGLEWHGSTLLRRVTGVVARAVDGPVLVVTAPGQEIPTLPPAIERYEDPREGLGPMQGLATGLAALVDRADLVFVCSTDLPFLHTAFVRAILRGFDDAPEDEEFDAVVPVVHGFAQPLAAGFRTSVLPKVERLLAEQRLRLAFLFDECRVARLDGETLRRDSALALADPALESVRNVNRPEEYAEARSQPAPNVTVQTLGILASNRRAKARMVPAATLARAAAQVGLTLGAAVVVALNGNRIEGDGELPLETGDIVSFSSADSANSAAASG